MAFDFQCGEAHPSLCQLFFEYADVFHVDQMDNFSCRLFCATRGHRDPLERFLPIANYVLLASARPPLARFHKTLLVTLAELGTDTLLVRLLEQHASCVVTVVVHMSASRHLSSRLNRPLLVEMDNQLRVVKGALELHCDERIIGMVWSVGYADLEVVRLRTMLRSTTFPHVLKYIRFPIAYAVIGIAALCVCAARRALMHTLPAAPLAIGTESASGPSITVTRLTRACHGF